MRNISKEFPGVQALSNVSFELKRGEVHVLMGENGAGKSTLMKILAGIYTADAGEVLLENEAVQIDSPRGAIQLGISMVHQELNPIPYMTVGENIFVGREPKRYSFGIVDKKKLYKQAKQVFERINSRIEPRREMRDLRVAEAQMVEIAKATSYRAKIIIMDEPTSAITDAEVKKLFQIIEYLTSQGVSIIYISHKMDEIFRIADRITVLRDGEYIGTYDKDRISRTELISAMVGREIKNIFPKNEVEIGETLLEVKDLTVEGLFSPVSFSVRRGEILGIAGLMGAGRTEVVETLFGMRKKDAGSVLLDGVEIEINSPEDAIRNGLAIITEDRKAVGLNLKGTVKENITMVKLKSYCTAGIIKKRLEARKAGEKIQQLKIKTPNKNQITENLSGGNQQKVVVAKWLLAEPCVLIMDEPTRGIDVGAKAEIHKLISDLAAEGKAVIMISSELPEIIGMSDRAVVMYEGRVTGCVERADMNQETIMHLATGHAQE
ncbi:MAG: sugar ABC transporter ATP-binding protein [Spirochaetia bacterium]